MLEVKLSAFYSLLSHSPNLGLWTSYFSLCSLVLHIYEPKLVVTSISYVVAWIKGHTESKELSTVQ